MIFKNVKKRIKFMIIIGIIIIITVISIQYSLQISIENKSNIKGSVTINENIIKVEIADEVEERSRGLMFRRTMERNTGMLFLFNEEGIYSFWMMNVFFNLDIIWINNNGVIIHIERDLPSCFINCPSYSSKIPAKYVLELNAGVAEELNLSIGSVVNINLLNN